MTIPPNPTEPTRHQPDAAAAAPAPAPDASGTADTPADAVPHLDEQIAKLNADITMLEAQKADLTDRLLRTVAEMDNVRKRLEREKTDVSRYAITKFATDVVALGDNLGHAMKSVTAEMAAATPAVKTLLDGVVMTDRAFISSLERHGIRRVDPVGEPFNPHLHQAVQQQRNVDVPAGTVLRVLQTGYTLDDRVLRPAAVIVAEGGAKAGKPAAAAETPAGTDGGDTDMGKA